MVIICINPDAIGKVKASSILKSTQLSQVTH